jgi:hypothetical protein
MPLIFLRLTRSLSLNYLPVTENDHNNVINPATKYVVFRVSSRPLIKAHPKGTSVGRGSQAMVVPLARATTPNKGLLEAPNMMILGDRPAHSG